MITEHSLLLAWFEKTHNTLFKEVAPPKTLSSSQVFAACELLGHYIVYHLKFSEVGLCGFESFHRSGDSERTAFRRQNEAQKRRGILLNMTARLEAVLLPQAQAAYRWSKVLIVEPHYGNVYQKRLFAMWEETTIAEKFFLVGGDSAAQEECGNLTRKELAELASIFCGRGTRRSGQQDPDTIDDDRLVVSVEQIKNAREKVSHLLDAKLHLYSFPLIDVSVGVPVFFPGLQKRASWIGKT